MLTLLTLVIWTVVACGNEDADTGTASATDTDGAESAKELASFAESTRTHGAVDARSVFSLEDLADYPLQNAPLLVKGTFTDVQEDRGWVNLNEAEIRNGIDTREISFSSSEAHFRTIRAMLDVEEVLYAGGGVETEDWRREIESLGQIELTLVLHNDSTFRAAASELPALGELVVPIVESNRGSWGKVLEPMSGHDILVRVSADGALDMPFADRDIAQSVLGNVDSHDELVQTVRDLAPTK